MSTAELTRPLAGRGWTRQSQGEAVAGRGIGSDAIFITILLRHNFYNIQVTHLKYSAVVFRVFNGI